MQQNAQHWKQKYLEKVSSVESVDAILARGAHLVECASEAVKVRRDLSVCFGMAQQESTQRIQNQLEF